MPAENHSKYKEWLQAYVHLVDAAKRLEDARYGETAVAAAELDLEKAQAEYDRLAIEISDNS